MVFIACCTTNVYNRPAGRQVQEGHLAALFGAILIVPNPWVAALDRKEPAGMIWKMHLLRYSYSYYYDLFSLSFSRRKERKIYRTVISIDPTIPEGLIYRLQGSSLVITDRHLPSQ